MCNEKLPRHEQELWRANTYYLLTRLLARPPSQRLVAQLSEIPPLQQEEGEEPDPIALAWSELGEASRRVREASLLEEYQVLFDGEGGGALNPRASWYLTGEAGANSMGLLRAELAGLGITPLEGWQEDHAGTLCDIMGALIEAEDPRQIGFFTRHLKPWLPTFFRDMRLAEAADFYRPVGFLGEAFLEVEESIYGKSIDTIISAVHLEP